MEALRRIWQLAVATDEEHELAGRLQIPLALATAYLRRHSDVQNLFASPSSRLHDPFGLPDMATAVERIMTALAAHQRILIYGDFDVDGLTATTLLEEALRDLGAEHLECYIPDRLQEGYGVHVEAVEGFAERGVELIITVDCGISAHAALERAASLGLDVIVTDHHRPPVLLPMAHAIVCPLREDSLYPFPWLAGVGVAYKLAEGLCLARGRNRPTQLLDLVALGTLADQVPLQGENRALVQLGLRAMNLQPRPGLASLVQSARLEGVIDAEGVAFRLAPRLNAAGRLGAATCARQLLTSADARTADRLASELEQLNLQRQELEAQVIAEAVALLAASEQKDQPVLVLAKAGWHLGVLGIAAARLARRYGRPAILLNIQGDVARGSARSASDFDLYAALEQCQDCLNSYGGHAGAAGLSLPITAIDALRERLNLLAGQLAPRHWLPVLELDGEVKLGEIDQQFLANLALLEPCGEGNAAPLFMARCLTASAVRHFGQEADHLGLMLRDRSGCQLPAVAFRQATRITDLEGELDVAFRPVIDSWQGRDRLRLLIEDWRAGGDQKPGEGVLAAVLSIDTSCMPTPAQPRPRAMEPDLADWRGSEQRRKWDGPSCAWVLEAGQAREVTLALRSEGHKAQYYHQHLPASYRDLLQYQFETGEIDVLVSPDPGVWRPERLSQAVWLTPPATPVQFVALSADFSRVGLAFALADVSRAQEYWRQVVPERDDLALIYRLILSNERSANRPLPLLQLRAQVKERYPVGGPALVDLAMTVFAELDLLRLEYINGESTVILLPAPRGKMSLQDSPTYNSHWAAWHSWRTWVPVALEQPLSTYRCWFDESS